MIYIFPYNQVPDGSRIIIYGAGNIGQDYMHQVTSCGWYSLVAIVDRDYKVLGVDNPDTIGQMEYDYIIVGLEIENVSSQVKRYLLRLGVPDEKIIIPKAFPTFPAYSDTFETFMDNPIAAVEDYTHQLKRNLQSNKNPQFFRGIIYALRESSDKDDIKKKLLMAIDSTCDIQQQITLMAVMYNAQIFDCSLMDRLLKTEMKLQYDTDTKYFLALFNSMMALVNPEWRHDDFYLDIKEIFKQICLEYRLTMPPVIKKPSQTLRVCMVVGRFVPGIFHSPTETAYQLANEMVRQGCQVCIVPVDANYFERASLLFGNSDKKSQSRVHEKYVSDILDFRVSIEYLESKTIHGKLQNLLDTISQYAPDIIFDLSDDQSPASYVYSQHVPTLVLPIRSTMVSSWHTKVLSGTPQKALSDNLRFRVTDNSCIVPYPPYIKECIISSPYDRASYNIGLSDTVLISVGFRLSQELDDGLADAMCQMLLDNNHLRWILVGDNASPYMREHYSNLFDSNQIIIWGIEKRLPDLYAICDIYINPARIGGGLSVAMAINIGMPVVSLVGSEGAVAYMGESLPLCNSHEDMVSYTNRLALDKEFYHEISRRTKIMGESRSIENCVAVIIKEMKKMISD